MEPLEPQEQQEQILQSLLRGFIFLAVEAAAAVQVLMAQQVALVGWVEAVAAAVQVRLPVVTAAQVVTV